MKLFVSFALFCTLAVPAFAHKMEITAKAEAKELRVVVGYEGADAQAASKATVTVYDDNKQEVASGETDTSGVCVLAMPKAGKYRIVVDDHQGHIAKEDLEIKDDEVTTAQTKTMNRFAAAGLGAGLLAGMGWVLRKWGKNKPNPITT